MYGYAKCHSLPYSTSKYLTHHLFLFPSSSSTTITPPAINHLTLCLPIPIPPSARPHSSISATTTYITAYRPLFFFSSSSSTTINSTALKSPYLTRAHFSSSQLPLSSLSATIVIYIPLPFITLPTHTHKINLPFTPFSLFSSLFHYFFFSLFFASLNLPAFHITIRFPCSFQSHREGPPATAPPHPTFFLPSTEPHTFFLT